jgi:LemA protein
MWFRLMSNEDGVGKRRLMVLCALVILSASGCGYNTMHTNEEAVKAAWGDVEATYQRRNDLIPNLY